MNGEFIEALLQIEREKGISKDVLIDAIEAALISAYKRNYGSAQNVKVYINRDTGDVKVVSLNSSTHQYMFCYFQFLDKD